MDLVKGINRVRRNFFRRLTSGLGKSKLGRGDLVHASDFRRILICRPNHRLGNLLLITPLLAEVHETFPEARIDLFVKGSIAPVLFRHYPGVSRIIQLPKKPMKNILAYLGGWTSIMWNRYDLVINVMNHSSSGKIAANVANARFRFMGEIDDAIGEPHNARFPIYSFRKLMGELGLAVDHRNIAPLDLRLTPEEIVEGKRILDKLTSNGKPSIALYTYATGAKCYDEQWWEETYGALKNRFPEFNIIEILPVENVSQIAFKAPSFYSRDLRQIGGLIANTAIFIGADSGMMHLASASGTPVIGLFKADNVKLYEPYNKGSVGVHTGLVDRTELLRIIRRTLDNAVDKRSLKEG